MGGKGATVKLSQQLAEALADALDAEHISQADLARDMGLSAKHVNHMVNGKSGALGMYDFAAHTLSRRWVVTLEYAPQEGEA
jgi:transcriptional regulator with XRE-family HTH domain